MQRYKYKCTNANVQIQMQRSNTVFLPMQESLPPRWVLKSHQLPLQEPHLRLTCPALSRSDRGNPRYCWHHTLAYQERMCEFLRGKNVVPLTHYTAVSTRILSKFWSWQLLLSVCIAEVSKNHEILESNSEQISHFETKPFINVFI